MAVQRSRAEGVVPVASSRQSTTCGGIRELSRGFLNQCRKPTGNDRLEKWSQCPCGAPVAWKLDRFRMRHRSRVDGLVGRGCLATCRAARTADASILTFTIYLSSVIQSGQEWSSRPEVRPSRSAQSRRSPRTSTSKLDVGLRRDACSLRPGFPSRRGPCGRR